LKKSKILLYLAFLAVVIGVVYAFVYVALIAVVAGILYAARTRKTPQAALAIRLLGIGFFAGIFVFFLYLHRISGGPDGGRELQQLYLPAASILTAVAVLAADSVLGWKKQIG